MSALYDHPVVRVNKPVTKHVFVIVLGLRSGMRKVGLRAWWSCVRFRFTRCLF